ncbi:tail fiber/spike domain-containing protein [Lelliottia amnigena]|uniref:tail fiber/spike domain-containing protein n=1 Tax=Lelliottia amnigena TaxID=61646 RepID=UPI0040563780
MATQPTQDAVPSESPRDLKFNAGKIDEFATSMGWTYTDRFGNQHYTIEGLRWLAQQSMAAFGYVTIDSFEDGATLTEPNEVLRFEATGEYYRWDGSFLPSGKVVPPASTPETSGGVGLDAWLSVGDATLRSQLPFITFEQFGVKGDGTDETAKIINAASFANANGLKLVAKPTQIFKLVGSSPVTFNYSVDFNGATIDVSNYTGTINLTSPTAKVDYLPGSSVVTALQTEATLTGQYFSGWLNTTEVDDSYVLVETNIPFYNYLGTVYNRTDMHHSTRYGVMADSLRFSLLTSAITKVTVYKNEKKNTFFKNLNLKTGAQTQSSIFIIRSSRLIIENVFIDSSNVQLTSQTATFNMNDSFDIKFRNVKAKWVNNTTLTGAYIFAGFRCCNVTFEDCGAEGTGWGAVGTSLCKNVKYIDCRLSRIDSHHPFIDRLDIVRGTVGSWGITASAIGDMYIDGTVFEIDNLPKQEDQAAVIKSRADVGGLFDGDIHLRDVTVKNFSSSTEFLMAQLNSIGGVPAGSPVTYRFGRNIVVDGLNIQSSTLVNISPKVQQGSGCQWPSRVYMKNVIGNNNYFWEQAFALLTPSAITVTSQAINMPLRGRPNTYIHLDNVTLAKEGISLSEGATTTQKFLFDIIINNIHGAVDSIYPATEWVVGGVVSIDESMIEGLDFYLGTFTQKPIQVSVSNSTISHTGQYNTALLNGVNGFVRLDMKGVGIYALTTASLASAMSAKLVACSAYLNTGASTLTVVADMNSTAGTYSVLNPTFNQSNTCLLQVGSGANLQFYQFVFPAQSSTVYVPVSQASGVNITRSADGASITTTFVGSPAPRAIVCI